MCLLRDTQILITWPGCRCVSPVLIVVAAMTHGRSVFVSPPDKRAEAAAARAQITANSTAAKSDHLAIIAAFNGWTAAWTKGGRQQAHTVSNLYAIHIVPSGTGRSPKLLFCRTHSRLHCILQHSSEVWQELESCLATCNFHMHLSYACSTSPYMSTNACNMAAVYYHGQCHSLSKAVTVLGMRFGACSTTYHLS